jgi:hypothetical protein
LTDVKNKKLEADPVTGEELESIARAAAAQPREVVEHMKKILGE